MSFCTIFQGENEEETFELYWQYLCLGENKGQNLFQKMRKTHYMPLEVYVNVLTIFCDMEQRVLCSLSKLAVCFESKQKWHLRGPSAGHAINLHHLKYKRLSGK